MPTTPDGGYLKAVGTTITALYTSSVNTNDSCNWIRATNVTAVAIVTNWYFYPLGNSGSAIRLCRNVPLDPGQSFEFRGVRYMLATAIAGDVILVQSDTASSLDCHFSTLRKANTDPPPQRERTVVQGLTTVQAVYTAPVIGGTVNDLSICANSGSTATIQIERVNGAVRTHILKDHMLDASGIDGIYSYPGVITLDPTEKIEVTATTAVDVIVSALEA